MMRMISIDKNVFVPLEDAEQAIAAAVAAERERVRANASRLIQIAANMVNIGISEYEEDWNFPKTMPKRTARIIISEAERWNKLNMIRAREIKEVFDEITNTNPPAGERRGSE